MKILRFVSVVVIAAVLLGGVLAANLWIFVITPSGLNEAKTVVIERGMRVDEILDTLQNNGVIGSAAFFRAYVLLKGNASKIRAGEYVFQPRVTPAQVLDQLMKGDFATRRVTIPEGWNIREIARNLAKSQLVDPDRFVAKTQDTSLILSLGLPVTSLEGYLFPDTYEIYRPKDEEEVIRKLVGRFQEVYAKEFEARAKEVGQETGMTQNDVVTLASIVEKETGDADERPLIASVFLNRLKIGMPLATDPAVIYGIPDFDGNLTKQHLTTPGPYNTYLNPGLPPTPISSPGAASLRAVLYPAQSDYLYFVSKNDGTHHFSRTEEEHNAAVRRFQLEKPRQRPETSPTGP